MIWTQLKVSGRLGDLENISAIVSMIDSSIMVEDYSDIEENLMTVYGELIDESILSADREAISVSIFVPEDKNYNEYVAFIKERLAASEIDAEVTLSGLDETDWENAWKAHYHPLHIGEKLVVVPTWETYDAAEGEVTIKMDPGMAFGSGTHETTRLCAAMIEKHMPKGARVLDIGTGTGVIALMMAQRGGARRIVGVDIEQGAVECATDKQGRILIPSALRVYSFIEKDIVFIGMSNRIEVWSQMKWDSYNNEALDMELLASQMEELGI